MKIRDIIYTETMDSTKVGVVLTDAEEDDIVSCVRQYLKKYNPDKDKPFVVSVWFWDIANQYFNSHTEPGGYLVMYKYKRNFRNPDNITKFKKIWDRGMLPIEVTQKTGSYFFGVYKELIYSDMFVCELIDAEHL